MEHTDEKELIKRSLDGDKRALEQLLTGVQDLIFNMSLRMLGTITDAQDASQDIMVKIITGLSSFKQTSSFTTWVYRLSVNSLLNYKKTFLSKQQLSFELFSDNLSRVENEITEDIMNDFEREELAHELKLSCTNVMLQCLDPQSRCVFILGTMFNVDSKTAGDIMGISPELYRKKLSRSRQKMKDFMSKYCGLAGGICDCKRRVEYAIQQKRLDPQNTEYSNLISRPLDSLFKNMDAMEEIDIASGIYGYMRKYNSPQNAKDFLINLLTSNSFQIIQKS